MTGEINQSAVPWRSPTLRVVLASTLLAPLGVPLVSPALPVIRDAFGVTDARASLVVSAYFLTGIVLSPFIGMLADRIGRRPVLIGCLFGFGLAGGAAAFAPSFEALLALRVVGGTAAAGIFVTTVTIIGDLFEGVERNAVLGMNNAVLSLGAAAFPVLGGALAAVSWNAPFLAYLAAVPLGLIAVRYLAEPAGEREARGLGYLRQAVGAIRGRKAVVLYGTAFVTELLLFGTIVTALPFLLSARYGLSPAFIGVFFAVSEVVAIVVSARNGWFARRVSNRGLIAAGFGCYAASLLGMWVAPSPPAFGVAVTAFGVGLGLSMPAVDAEISSLVANQHRGGALSLRNSTTFLGRATGPVLFAGVAATTGYDPLLLAGGVVAMAAAAFVLSTPIEPDGRRFEGNVA